MAPGTSEPRRPSRHEQRRPPRPTGWPHCCSRPASEAARTALPPERAARPITSSPGGHACWPSADRSPPLRPARPKRGMHPRVAHDGIGARGRAAIGAHGRTGRARRPPRVTWPCLAVTRVAHHVRRARSGWACATRCALPDGMSGAIACDAAHARCRPQSRRFLPRRALTRLATPRGDGRCHHAAPTVAQRTRIARLLIGAYPEPELDREQTDAAAPARADGACRGARRLRPLLGGHLAHAHAALVGLEVGRGRVRRCTPRRCTTSRHPPR